MPLGWAVFRSPLTNDTRRTQFRFWCELLLIAPLASVASIRIDLFDHFSLWPVLLCLLLSGDGRWLGALLGALSLGGRKGLRTMRLVLGSMACGPTQLAICAVLVHTRSIPDEFPLAIVLGAVMLELTAPVRRKVAAELERAESELEGPDER